MTIIETPLLLAVSLDIAVVLIGIRNACRREKAQKESSNVVDLDQYRRGSLVDVRV